MLKESPVLTVSVNSCSTIVHVKVIALSRELVQVVRIIGTVCKRTCKPARLLVAPEGVSHGSAWTSPPTGVPRPQLSNHKNRNRHTTVLLFRHLFLFFVYYGRDFSRTPLKALPCDTIRVVSQLLLQLHSPLLQLIQLFFYLTHFPMDVFYWYVLIRLHLKRGLDTMNHLCTSVLWHNLKDLYFKTHSVFSF